MHVRAGLKLPVTKIYFRVSFEKRTEPEKYVIEPFAHFLVKTHLDSVLKEQSV